MIQQYAPFRKALPLLLCFSTALLSAQNTYSGARIAIFEVQILQQKGQILQLRCRMANTGRQTLGSKNTSAEMLVEFDTLILPGLLRGHEAAIAAAVRGNCPKLKLGELSEPIWLDVRLQNRVAENETNTKGCAEIVFDTAYVDTWTERSMQVRFWLKNTGNQPAQLFAKNLEPLVNVYFVSGTKLTRGAIPAGSSSLKKGRETLDGILLPGETLEGTVEFNLKNRSKFSPNIALDFDPAQAVEECGRSGNVWVIRLR